MQRTTPRTLALALLSVVACASSSNDAAVDAATDPVDSGSSMRGPDGSVTPVDSGGGGPTHDGSSPNEASAPDAASPDAATVDASGGDASSGVPGPYGSDGPATVTTATFMVPSPNGTFSTTGYIPSGAGPFPTVILSSGFFQPAAAYAPYGNRLASWGIVALLRDDPNLGEGTPAIVSDVQYTVSTWLSTTNADSSSALYGKLDPTRVGLAGHSRGGQIALLAGEGLMGKIQGVFGLDPVDTAMSGDPQARTTLAAIGVPVAFIGETTDSAASSCAPAADNFQVLYTAASSPAVAITAIGADHTMFEVPASCFACTVCTAGTANQAQVIGAAERYLTAFFARQLLGDATVGPAFNGAGAQQDLAAGLIQIESK